MSNFIIKTKKIILLLGDIGVFYLALYLTLIARYSYPIQNSNWERHLLPFSLVFVFWLIVLFISEFYELKTSHNTNNLISIIVKLSIINGIIAIVMFYFFTPFIDTIRPQRVLIIDLIFSGFLLFCWRKIFFRFIKSPNIANRVLIIGQTPLSTLLKKEINKRTQLGYQAEIIAQASEDLPMKCIEDNIDILISAYDLKNHPNTSQKIFNCLSLGVDVYNINSFYEQVVEKIPIEYIEHSWFLENLAEHSKKFYEIIKRISDIVLSLIGLLIAIPLTPIISLMIKMGSSGPIIFKQTRTGKNNKKFMAMKFRSMVANAEKNGPQWAEKNDSRVTRFGSFMRKTRIDEIPQLINILRGEMSFVGPRPERPEFVEILARDIPFYNERLLVKPGLAGWAQLKGPAYGGSKEESLEKLKYDLYYIKNRSLLLDIGIILKTIKIVLNGKGR